MVVERETGGVSHSLVQVADFHSRWSHGIRLPTKTNEESVLIESVDGQTRVVEVDEDLVSEDETEFRCGAQGLAPTRELSKPPGGAVRIQP